jgi:hypothetical protein
MTVPFTYTGPVPEQILAPGQAYLSGPADTAEKQKLSIYFGDDYTADILITLPDGIDHETCTAHMALSKEDEPNVRLEKTTTIFSGSGKLYVRFSLDKDDYVYLKPGRYNYDVEVRTASDDRGTKVSSKARIYDTYVR